MARVELPNTQHLSKVSQFSAFGWIAFILALIAGGLTLLPYIAQAVDGHLPSSIDIQIMDRINGLYIHYLSELSGDKLANGGDGELGVSRMALHELLALVFAGVGLLTALVSWVLHEPNSRLFKGALVLCLGVIAVNFIWASLGVLVLLLVIKIIFG